MTFNLVNVINGYKLYANDVDICASVIEDVYYDDEFVYYFPCLLSSKFLVVIDDKVFSLHYVFENRLIEPSKIMALVPELLRRPMSNKDWSE